MSFARNLLWRRTADWLAAYRPTIIAVTGSTGKSTTRDAIAAALAPHHRIRTAQQPYNDPQGVALGILGIDQSPKPQHWFKLLTNSLVKEIAEEEPDVVVVEVGADRPGHVDWLAPRLRPHVTVVTNVGSANLDFFHSKKNVAHELLSLPAATADNGIVVLNADDPLVADMQEHIRVPIFTYGHDDSASVYVRRAQRLRHHGFALEVAISGRVYELHLPHIVARPQLYAVLAALTVTHGLQQNVDAAIEQLQRLQPLPGRLSLAAGRNNALLIDDSYHATPESMHGALGTLQALPYQETADTSQRQVRRIAILGDITGLGGQSSRLHQQIGKQVAQVANVFIAVGQHMRVAGAEALKLGCDVHHFDRADDVGKWLADYIGQHDVILISGARAMAMQKVVDRLRTE